MMNILSYRQGAKRIARQRQTERDASRDDIVRRIYWKLVDLKPNTRSNIRHPWKLSERFSLRAWCPLHNGRWARLIVRADETGHVTYACARGCTSDEVDQFLSQPTRAAHVRNAVGIAPAHVGKSDDTSGVVIDAQHLFCADAAKSGGSNFEFEDDPAA